MIIALVVFLLLGCLYIYSTRCRSGHPCIQNLRGWAYAHRGLHSSSDGVPENSIKAFQLAKDAGYGIEFDVHLLADGNLAVIHDASLKRTVGAEVYIEDLTAEQLNEYFLEGTDEQIPIFQQVLDIFSGEAPLIIELKAERNNYAKLCQKVCDIMDSYSGPYCIESFDPRCIRWLRRNRPDIIRGQLAENYFALPNSKLPFLLKLVLSFQMMNFLTMPDFVSYRFHDRKNLSNFLCRKLWKTQGVTWTIKSMEDFDTAVAENWLPIFEGFRP